MARSTRRARKNAASTATDATVISARTVTHLTRSMRTRRLIRLPSPVPRSSEKSVTVSE